MRDSASWMLKRSWPFTAALHAMVATAKIFVSYTLETVPSLMASSISVKNPTPLGSFSSTGTAFRPKVSLPNASKPKPKRSQKFLIIFQYLCFHRCQAQHYRAHQMLRNDSLLTELVHEIFVENPLMGCMLVDEVHTISLFHHPVWCGRSVQ